MKDRSFPTGFSGAQWSYADDIESQHDNVVPDDGDGGIVLEPAGVRPTGHSSRNADSPFTVVPNKDPNQHSELEGHPMLQSRGARNKESFQAQHDKYQGDEQDKGRTRQIQLFNGNLILDCPIPPRFLEQVPHAQPPERDEFTHSRYSAVTGDPADFRQERYVLRPLLFTRPRITELLIGVTVYNENEVELGRTLEAVMRNVEYLCSRQDSATWGRAAWKKVVVCIISDGRNHIHPRSLALLAALGVYQEGLAKVSIS